jgi:hypothetical protein
MEAETAVERAIFSLAGTAFAKIINPALILFVAVAIAVFLYIIFKAFLDSRNGKVDQFRKLWVPIVGLTIMLSAIGITYFIGNTANEVFQGPTGGGAVKGIGDVVRPIEIR